MVKALTSCPSKGKVFFNGFMEPPLSFSKNKGAVNPSFCQILRFLWDGCAYNMQKDENKKGNSYDNFQNSTPNIIFGRRY